MLWWNHVVTASGRVNMSEFHFKWLSCVFHSLDHYGSAVAKLMLLLRARLLWSWLLLMMSLCRWCIALCINLPRLKTFDDDCRCRCCFALCIILPRLAQDRL